MGLRQWPLNGGQLMQFYSGGFGSNVEDCKRLLRHVARWLERHPKYTPESVNVYAVLDMTNEEDPATWAATVLMGTDDD